VPGGIRRKKQFDDKTTTIDARLLTDAMPSAKEALPALYYFMAKATG